MAAEPSVPVAGLTPVRFAALLAAVLSVSMAYGVSLPLLPFILERLLAPGYSSSVSAHAGMLTALYTLALFILSPIWGTLSDRFNRRFVISFGLVGSGVSLVMLDNVSSLMMLYASRMMSGVFSAAVLPPTLAYIAETCGMPERQKKYAIVASFVSLGFMLGSLVGGWLSPMVLSPSTGMWLAGVFMPDSPFFLIALTAILCASGMVFLSGAEPIRSDMVGGAVQADGKRIEWLLLLTLITLFGVSVAEVGITLLGKLSLSLDPGTISRFFVICSLVMIAVQIGMFPMLIRKFPLHSLLVFAFSLGAFGLGLIPYTSSAVVIGVLFGMIAAATGVLVPTLTSLISQAAGGDQGKVFGQQVSVANLGQAIAAASTGILFAASPAAPFLMASAMLAAGALIVLWRRQPWNW